VAGSGSWRYIAQRYTGDDGALGDFIDFNVPLMGANIADVLSGHNSLTGSITPEYMRLKGPDGRPILEEKGCAIWAEDPDGEIRGGGLLTHSQFEGPNWGIECTDLTGTSIGLPYTDANFWIGVDPIDLFRYIWGWIQSQPGGNVGIDVDVAHSPVRLGDTMIQRVDFDLEDDPSLEVPVPVPTQPNPFSNNEEWLQKGIKVMHAVGWTKSVVESALRHWLAKVNDGKAPPITEREAMIKDKVIQKIGWPPNPPPPKTGGPDVTYVLPPGQVEPPVVWEYDAYKLAWYKDLDLSKVVDDLATLTPFDWHLTHAWSDESDDATIRHTVRVGYPRLGRRREELRFVIGENIHTVPRVERDGTDYANEVLFLGAGEGSAQISGRAFRRGDGKVRTVAVVSDSSVTDQRLANMRAEQELAKRIILDDIAEIVLEDHPNAPMGSVDLGDEILLEGETGWVDLEVWCRVVGRSMSPDSGEAMNLTVIRSDRLL
jgi:hypothetical protein